MVRSWGVWILTFTTLWNRQQVEIFVFIPENKIGIFCKLSPKETICKKCQILFSEKKNMKKIYFKLLSAEILPSM